MSTIVHFDVPADDGEWAKKFYNNLFGWIFSGPPGYPDNFLVETSDLEGKPLKVNQG